MTFELLRNGTLEERASLSMRASLRELAARIDRSMAKLLGLEWLGVVAIASWISPRTWNGTAHSIHPHLMTTLLMGPLIVGVPGVLAALRPSQVVTRHVVAVSQMLMSVLLIDATGGRIESHFHIFGSLAFLAFYRDWRVLITASIVTAIDHLIAGLWWPQSIYGVAVASPWRWMEHTWWVAFEDLFLIVLGQQSLREMWTLAVKQAQLAFGAGHDVLTGAANRLLLKERFYLDEAHSDSFRKAVLFIDLDRFKHINDTLGHGVGDRLLVLVARRLSRLVRSGDTVARIGGDEFVALIEGADQSVAETIAEHLVSGFNRPFEIDGTQLLLSVSVGISLAPEHGTELATLQQAADVAMYEAKSRGRNDYVLFSPSLLQREENTLRLKRDLAQALNREELHVYFQPQVNPDGRLKSFEALARWQHPVLGIISPTIFIPMAEASGLIVSLGEWVLRSACASCRQWQREGYAGVRIAVNVSAEQLEQDDFSERVATVLEEVALDPSLLTIEITESVLLRDVPKTLRHLNRLRAMAVQVVLDDFGTGYSSLSYLQDLRADGIKLDPSLVKRGLADNDMMLESIIEMAHRNGLQVTGEGIETADQGRMLRKIGCDLLQGYCYGAPMPPELIPAFLASFRKTQVWPVAV